MNDGRDARLEARMGKTSVVSSAAVTSIVTDETVEDGNISVQAAAIGNEESEAIRARIKDRRENIDQSYWDLSQDMYRVEQNTLYIEWGYENFLDYVEKELNWKYRSVAYMLGIAKWFGEASPEIQAWVKSIGWSKAKELTGKVTDENFHEWKTKIAGKSVAQIIEMKANEKSGKKEKADSDEETKRLAFRLYGPQYENVTAAIKLAQNDSDSDSTGHALDVICTQYLATSQGSEGLNGYLASIEKLFGVAIVAYSKSTDEVVFGQDLIDAAEAAVSEENEDSELPEDV